ncbi:MAG: PhzF family phenazine biosynthesis protein [Phaeodactylibacter sp.]|nr:PhzF family phenazine biosynthesis protein [Phaeodactylibacter sp.]
MNIPIYQVDAFTGKLFRGNPAAVCPLDKWLPEATMQAIAAENNLSETAFFIPKGQDYQLRWFTPAIEVDLCGHATLATAHVLFQHLDYQEAILNFHSRSGLLSVSRQEGHYIMDFPTDILENTLAPKVLAEALRVQPREVLIGREDFLAVLDSEAEVAALQPDFRLLRQVKGRGVIVTAPGESVDFVSRCFFPNAGIDEDPVTGSAHTTMTPYWAERLGKQELTARQISRRGGELRCTMLGERVALAGQAVTYMEGVIGV